MQPEHTVPTPNQKKPLGSSFRRMFAAVSMTSMGDGLTFNALPWLAATLTGNALLVSLVSFATRLRKSETSWAREKAFCSRSVSWRLATGCLG